MHFWFVIATLAQETELMKRMSAQGISSYYLLHGKTPLDLWTVQFYRNLGVSCKSVSKPEGFEPGLNIGTYGDFIMQTTHPKEISERIDRFFKKYKHIEDVNLTELVDIATAETSITFTVIKDPVLARTLREKIMGKF